MLNINNVDILMNNINHKYLKTNAKENTQTTET